MFRYVTTAGAYEREHHDVVIDRPNRDKASSKATKAVVVLLLVVSAVLTAIVTFGGWEKLAGMKAISIGYILVYLGMAFLILRWNRGALPLAGALAIILGIFAAIAGPQWFTRDKAGFTNPALDADFLGMITLIIVPVQLLLIIFAMRGFQQAWNVEIERHPGYGADADYPSPPSEPQPA